MSGRCIVVFVVFVTFSSCSTQNPQVTIDQGTLQGFYDTTVNGRQFSAFNGIPYAAPPVGNLRFREPQPAQKWNDTVYNATSYGSGCMAYSHFTYKSETPVVGKEDCLFVNVYTPKLPDGNSTLAMDVIVFFHGGAFMFGSGKNFNGNYLLDRDIVFVTFNYRLGPLGFLSTEDEVVPGNNGLKDQTEMLRWIQKNIAAFGGNASSVTLIGSSAGGASVHYHYLSPLSKGLFHRGFSCSGTVLSSWAMMEKGRQKAEQVGQSLGCPTNTTTSLVECLRRKPALDIVMSSKQFMGWLYNPYSPYAPTIEKWGSQPFLNDDPYKLLKEGKFQQLPWMTSDTSEEGLYPGAEFIASAELLEELDKNWTKILPHLLDFDYTLQDDLKAEVSKEIRLYYLQNRTVAEDTAQLIQMIGDRLFVSSAVEAAKVHASTSQAPVYFYYFSYRGNQSFSSFLTHNDINYGVSHVDDLAYFLKVFYLNPLTNENDKTMSKEFINIISSFAKDGRPITTENMTFPTVQEGLHQLRYVHIKSFNECIVKDTQTLGHTDFWFSLPFQENINIAVKNSASTSKSGGSCIVLITILNLLCFISLIR